MKEIAEKVAAANVQNISQGISQKQMKLMSLALVLKILSQDKVTTILNKFDSNDSLTISQYMNMADLESHLDGDLITDCLKEINESYTDIDKTFELILDTLIKNNGNQSDLPKNILIISDMEFDRGIYSKNSTNFEGWKKAFNSAGFDLPNIIFWNVAGYIKGLPVTSLTDNVSMISGFSQNILENLFTLENYSPINLMLDKLKVYLDLL